ncbi:hypothetical protein [Chroococcidiopsis sp. CCMEE 29]|uniref:hypothetical protein n=1 Tax=Chroococcidiopsis sp. CCMEE 29 TaxID=155894 RepID=UPI002022480C|nr:hypothetical protein [Chroococcidiopsis sp. CCMEE 29]
MSIFIKISNVGAAYVDVVHLGHAGRKCGTARLNKARQNWLRVAHRWLEWI